MLATVVSKEEAGENVDFLPHYLSIIKRSLRLLVRFLAVSSKREGRLSDHEVLICRLVDRALRPMFPSDYHADTQVMISLISADENA